MRFLLLIFITYSLAFASTDTNSVAQTPVTDTVGESDTQVEDTTLQELNLAEWNHPARTVLEKNGLKVTGVVLKDKVYPRFYVDGFASLLSTNREVEALQLFTELYKANGYWPYSLIDSTSEAVVMIEGDKEKKAITKYTINGSVTYFDDLRKEELTKIHSAIMATDPALKDIHIQFSEDLNGDKSPEIVTLKDDIVALFSWNGELQEHGELDPKLATMYTIDSVQSIYIDQSKEEKSIILYMHHTGSGAEGYALFNYDGKKSTLLETNFPSTTGAGNRSLADMDDDKILEAVTTFEIEGKQQRIISMYQEIGATDDTYITTSGYGEKGFVHPQRVEDLIISFIEAVSLTINYNCDYSKEISKLSTKNMKYNEESPLYKILNPSSIAAYPPSLELKENFKNGNEILYTFRLSGDSENRSYYCNIIRDGDLFKVDSIE